MSKLYELGPFVLDPQAGTLTRSGVPTALGSRAVAVLTALIEHPYEYVSKSRIIDAAWQGVVVEEGNLAVQISAIRRVLAQAPGGEHWVETLTRRGYRFVGPVAEDAPNHLASDLKPSNLPEPLTSFIGRERELVEVKRLLPSNRVVTLVGIGGIGKTRLALQAGIEVTDAYRDGSCFVELGAITDPALVSTTAACALGVAERIGSSPTAALCRHLKARELLLLLDNCEHLADACAALVEEILREAPHITILATSREPLRAAGEQIYPLHPLSLPDRATAADLWLKSDAVGLFVERARRQQPDFDATAARIAPIAELCIHLDGIPLALELAAACIRSLSVEQINARIDDRFRLLTGGPRTAAARQQTLRATFDWSYELLAREARKLLLQLSVFPSSFTLEAAEAIAFDRSSDGNTAVDLLSQLVNASVVVADTSERGVRYRLLETTRAYALDKLGNTGEMTALRRRHAQFFSRMFEHASDEWQRIAETDWKARYQSELDNVRAAFDWAFGPTGDDETGIALCAGAGELWYIMSLRREGQQRLETAIGRIGPATCGLHQAMLWRWLGEMLALERPARAVAALERAVELHRRARDGAAPAIMLIWLSEELTLIGRIDEAAVALAEARTALEPDSLAKTWAQYYLVLGNVTRDSGDLAGTRANYERGLSHARSVGAESLLLGALVFLADLTWETGDLEAAASGFSEAARLMRRRPRTPKGHLGLCLTNLAGIHTERDELDAALAAAREGLPLRKEDGHSWGAMDHMALRAALAGNTSNAARLAGYADAAYAANASPRQSNEMRARNRLHGLLRERLAMLELEHLLAEGATLSEDEACRLALEE